MVWFGFKVKKLKKKLVLRNGYFFIINIVKEFEETFFLVCLHHNHCLQQPSCLEKPTTFETFWVWPSF